MKSFLLILISTMAVFFYSNAAAQNTTSWTDTTGGSWNDAGKWSNGVPDTNSDVVINLQGNYSITLQNDVTIKSLTFGNSGWGTQSLNFAGFQLTLNGGNSIISDGATTYLEGNIINKGTLTFTGSRKKIITPSLDNLGIINIDGPIDFYYPFKNEVNCKVDVINDALIQAEYSGVLVNKGTLIKSSGNGRANIKGPFTNEDSIIVNSGTLILSGSGQDNFWGGIYYAAAGDSLINAVDVTNNASYAKGILTGNPDGEIIFEGGNFFADSSEAVLNFGGTGLKWINGVINQIGGGNWRNIGKIIIEGQGQKIIAADFINDGMIGVNGSLAVNYQTFTNNPGRTIEISDSSNISSGYFGNFTNKGLLLKNSGTGTAVISAGYFTNQDSIIVNSGNLLINGTGPDYFFGGTYYAGAGDSLTIAVDVGGIFAKDTLSGNPDGYIVFEGNEFFADSAQAVLNFSGTGFQWRSGIFLNSGSSNWLNEGLIYATGSGAKSFSFVNFQNNGLMDIKSPLSVIGDNILVNNETGIMNVYDNFTFSSNHNDSFINKGLFKEMGSETAVISSQFENSGTIDITGTLNWNDNFGPDSTSILKIEADTLNNYGRLNISGQASLKGKATVALAPSSVIGDSILILTAQQGVADTFYSAESDVDTIGLQPSYLANSVSLNLFRNNVQAVENESIKLPNNYELSQNYPNPFNPSTKIRFDLPQSGLVTLKVYDILGKEVATLVNEDKSAGYYEVNFNASNFASGVYFYRITAGKFTAIKKLLLIK